MEELNKTQLILLALLVSFVTSIATGIVTVALMEQAPQGVTQTINRIVERTIETVQSGEETIVTYETVVMESELVKNAVRKNLTGLVVFYDGKNDKSRRAIGSGFLVTAGGAAIIEAGTLAQIIDGDMSAEYNGRIFSVRVFSYKKDSDFAIVQLEPIISEDDEKISIDESFFKPLSLAKEKNISLGDSIIAISATNDVEIAYGIVTRLEIGEVKTEDQAMVQGDVRYVHTDIDIPLSASGGPLVLLDGSVVGMVVSEIEGVYAVPAFVLKEALDVAVQQGVEAALGNEQAASLLRIKESVEESKDQTTKEDGGDVSVDSKLTPQ